MRGARAQLQVTGETLQFDYPVPKDPVILRDPEIQGELETYWGDANGGYLNT